MNFPGMTLRFHKPKRLAYLASSVAMLLASAAPAVLNGSASAAASFTARSIQMSSSAPGGVTAGTAVNYKVALTPATTGTKGIVIDFCTSPIISATCTAPAGLNVASATFTAGTNTASWAGTFTTSQAKVNAVAQPALTTAAADFTITGITNPTGVGSFYARVYTYSTVTYGTYSSATSVGNDMDEGGVALSVANLLTVNATVQETLLFCVSKATPTTQCGGTSSPALTLGNGGSPNILDTSVRSDTVTTQISTNAVTGATVYMKIFNNAGSGSVSCSGLSKNGGTTCPIAAIGAFGVMTAGTAKFGLNVANGAALGTGTGTAPADVTYGTTAGSYGMDDVNVRSAFGDIIFATNSLPCYDVNSVLTFAATAATTTPAGTYLANESLIATGSF